MTSSDEVADRPDESTDDRLLRLAREELAKTSGDLPLALRYLEQFRDAVLTMRSPGRLFDALPLAWAIQSRYDTPYTVRESARLFNDMTAAQLAPWPSIQQDYEHRLLTAQLDDLEARRRLSVLQLFPFIGLAVALAGVAIVLIDAIHHLGPGFSLAGLIAIPAGLLFAGLTFALNRIRDARRAAEIENVRRKLNLRMLTSGTASASPSHGSGSAATVEGEYFGSLVRINVDNLSDYYTQVRVHTNNSFWASIVAGALGFGLIAGGLGLGFARHDSHAVSFVATASGVVVEFISGVFFYLYNRTVRQLKDYHDSLLDVQNILLSFRIVEQSEATERGNLLAQILRFLLAQKDMTTPADAGSSSSQH